MTQEMGSRLLRFGRVSGDLNMMRFGLTRPLGVESVPAMNLSSHEVPVSGDLGTACVSLPGL